MLAKRMEELGYHRTWSQCRVKIKNLVAKYRKIKDKNRITGNNRQDFVFYTALDSVLGTRPASQPDTIISSDSSVSSQKNTDEDETDDDLTCVSEPEENLEEGEHGIAPDDGSHTDTAEETAGDRDDLSEDSFTASIDGDSSTTDKEKTPNSHKKRKGLYFTLMLCVCMCVCVCS